LSIREMSITFISLFIISSGVQGEGNPFWLETLQRDVSSSLNRNVKREVGPSSL